MALKDVVELAQRIQVEQVTMASSSSKRLDWERRCSRSIYLYHLEWMSFHPRSALILSFHFLKSDLLSLVFPQNYSFVFLAVLESIMVGIKLTSYYSCDCASCLCFTGLLVTLVGHSKSFRHVNHLCYNSIVQCCFVDDRGACLGSRVIVLQTSQYWDPHFIVDPVSSEVCRFFMGSFHLHSILLCFDIQSEDLLSLFHSFALVMVEVGLLPNAFGLFLTLALNEPAVLHFQCT